MLVQAEASLPELTAGFRLLAAVVPALWLTGTNLQPMDQSHYRRLLTGKFICCK
jgi:hypothetical protein